VNLVVGKVDRSWGRTGQHAVLLETTQGINLAAPEVKSSQSCKETGGRLYCRSQRLQRHRINSAAVVITTRPEARKTIYDIVLYHSQILMVQIHDFDV
jgi:hypothetical protein